MDPIASNLKRAFEAVNAGRIVEARGLCQKLIKVPELAGEVLFLQGLIAGKIGRHAEAVRLLDRAAKTMPPSVRLLSALGLACQAAGYWKRAGECFVQCIQLEPQSPRAYLKLADVCLDAR